MASVKQVIVFRHDLLKGEHAVRKGKIAGQVAHASLGSLLKMAKKTDNYIDDNQTVKRFKYEFIFDTGSVLDQWLNGIFTKVVVYVPDEAALLKLNDELDKTDIPHALITDAGNTEFHGVPTNTCLGIGPWYSEEIDKYTGDLSLL